MTQVTIKKEHIPTLFQSAGRFRFITLLLEKAIEKGNDHEVMETLKKAFASPATCEMCSLAMSRSNENPDCSACCLTGYGQRAEFSCLFDTEHLRRRTLMQNFLRFLKNGNAKLAREYSSFIASKLKMAAIIGSVENLEEYLT